MSDGDLSKWIAFLHAAAQVKPGDPDYADAQKAVDRAMRKIAFLNREANRRDVETPDALETARMSAAANVAGDVATIPVSALGSLPEVGPLLEPLSNYLTPIVRKLAGNLALEAKGADLAAYERGQEAHPTATAIGEMTGPVLMSLLGGVGRKPISRQVGKRLQPLPREAPELAAVRNFELVPPAPRTTSAPAVPVRPEMRAARPRSVADPRVGQAAVPGRPDLGRLVPAGPTQKAGSPLRTASPRAPDTMRAQQMQLIVESLKGVPRAEWPAKLEPFKALGMLTDDEIAQLLAAR